MDRTDHRMGQWRKKAVYGMAGIEAILYVAFIAAGIMAGRPFTAVTVGLQYASMTLVPVIALVCNATHSREFWLLMTALLMSLANETMMLAGSGIVAFIAVYGLVQMVYIIRHGRGRLPRPWIILTALTLWSAAAAGGIVRDLYPDTAVIVAVCLYGFLFTMGLAVVWRYENVRFARWGMTLFACCDTCLMLYYALGRPFLPGILVWMFFLPAQILLALSGSTLWRKGHG